MSAHPFWSELRRMADRPDPVPPPLTPGTLTIARYSTGIQLDRARPWPRTLDFRALEQAVTIAWIALQGAATDLAREAASARLMAARDELEDTRMAIWAALPWNTVVAYAYSPRENTGSTGARHIVAREPVTRGRFTREQGKPLCSSSRKFWGLANRPGEAPNCLMCLDAALRLLGPEAARWRSR